MRLLKGHGFTPTIMDARSDDPSTLLQGMNPRLLLVEDNDSDGVFAARLSGILKENPNIGVIRLNIQSNQLGLYSARQIMATRSRDLFNAIEQLARWSEVVREAADQEQIEEPAPLP